jgi:hypothetical protein
VRNFFKSDKNKYCSMNKKQPRSATWIYCPKSNCFKITEL